MSTMRAAMGLGPSPAPTTGSDALSWSERWAGAPCTETDPDLGFPEGTRTYPNSPRIVAAKKLCTNCPLDLREACLEIAMAAEGTLIADGRFGVYGGLDPHQRAQLAARRTAVAS